MDWGVAIVVDTAQSALDRLKVKAKKTGKSVQLLLQLFCQEEFFRRLESSSYQNNLILKGGLLIYSLSGFESRPTQDVDFLMRNHPNTESTVRNMMNSILSSPTQQSYIQFQVSGTSLIAKHREYNGVRVKLQAIIKNTRTPLQVDIGIGDVVIPKPVLLSIPVQLEGFDCPNVYAYSYESVIAEKWDAIISRMELTSRMKDFFDLYYLASHHDFDGRVLQEALFETLQKRGTPIDRDQLEMIRSLKDAPSMLAKWKAFMKSAVSETVELEVVIQVIVDLIGPPFEAVLLETEWHKRWDCNEMCFES